MSRRDDLLLALYGNATQFNEVKNGHSYGILFLVDISSRVSTRVYIRVFPTGKYQIPI